MSGIAGIVYPNVYQVNRLINTMLGPLEHRSAADPEIYTYKNIEIGIRGNALAYDGKKQLSAGLDGHLDNYKDLKKELVDKGHHFLTDSHSEVILNAYEAWQSEFLQHLRGDFALFILDEKKAQLLLGRDHIGKKPLYWYHEQNFFLFGSELKSLLATGIVPQTAATDAIAIYLFLGYIPQDMTPIKNVNKLLPSYSLEFDLSNKISIQPYWSLSDIFAQRSHVSQKQIIKNIDHMLTESILGAASSPEALGCFISGGLGSATVAYYLSKIKQSEFISGYTVGFQEESIEDIKAVQEVMVALSIPGKIELLSPDNFLDDFVKICWYLDEPIADPNVIATYKLGEIASSDTNHVFSGMGSDEFFAGHLRYTGKEQNVPLMERLLHPPLLLLKKYFISILNLFSKTSAYSILKHSRTDPWQLAFFTDTAIFPEKILERAAPDLIGNFDPEVFLHKFHGLKKITSTVSSFIYLDIKTRLVDCFIHQYERLTAAHSLRWSTPFLSQSIIEYMARLAGPQTIEVKETAFVIKSLIKNVFPHTFVERPKITRRHFLENWIEKGNLFEIFKLLHNGTLIETGLISRYWLENSLSNPIKAKQHFRQLWALLTLEIWFTLFINHPVENIPPTKHLLDLLEH